MIRMTLGKHIRRTRLRLDWTGRELARRLGIHYVYLSMIEVGRNTPSKALLERMSQLFEENGEPFQVDVEALRQEHRAARALRAG